MSIRGTILQNMENALNGIKEDPAYPIQIAEVSTFRQNLISEDNYNFPMVMPIDTGIEEIEIIDLTHVRFRWEPVIFCAVKTTQSETLHDDMGNLMSALRQFGDSSPSLGDNVLEFRLINTEGIDYDTTQIIAVATIEVQIRYWAAKGSY